MNEELNALAEILHSCGWTSPSDAQWTRLEAAIPDIRDALTAPAVAGEQRHYDSSTADVPPAGHPLQKLGEYLASLLDEDRWATAEQYLLAAWSSVAASATPPAAASKQDADREYAAWCMTVDWCDDAESDRCWSAFCAGRESAAPPAAVAVPEGMVLVRRKLIDESIARINCAIPGWEVHVHALNDALAAAPAAPSVRAVVVPDVTDAICGAGFEALRSRGFRVNASDMSCDDLAAVFKAMYEAAAAAVAVPDTLVAKWRARAAEHEASSSREYQEYAAGITDVLNAIAAAPASPAATGPVPVLLPVVPTAPILGVLNEMLTNCHSVEESYADLRRAAAAPSVDGEG